MIIRDVNVIVEQGNIYSLWKPITWCWGYLCMKIREASKNCLATWARSNMNSDEVCSIALIGFVKSWDELKWCHVQSYPKIKSCHVAPIPSSATKPNYSANPNNLKQAKSNWVKTITIDAPTFYERKKYLFRKHSVWLRSGIKSRIISRFQRPLMCRQCLTRLNLQRNWNKSREPSKPTLWSFQYKQPLARHPSSSSWRCR